MEIDFKDNKLRAARGTEDAARRRFGAPMATKIFPRLEVLDAAD